MSNNNLKRKRPSLPVDKNRPTEWAPQDRYNQIAPDRHRSLSQDREFAQGEFSLEAFIYRYTCDNTRSLDQECRRRGRHYREY